MPDHVGEVVIAVVGLWLAIGWWRARAERRRRDAQWAGSDRARRPFIRRRSRHLMRDLDGGDG